MDWYLELKRKEKWSRNATHIIVCFRSLEEKIVLKNGIQKKKKKEKSTIKEATLFIYKLSVRRTTFKYSLIDCAFCAIFHYHFCIHVACHKSIHFFTFLNQFFPSKWIGMLENLYRFNIDYNFSKNKLCSYIKKYFIIF